MIIDIIRKIRRNKWILRNIFQTIYFNFHYLPFSQAIYLPIWLYKPHFLKCKGSVIIETDGAINSGMIQLVRFEVGIYPNNGFIWENRGIVKFKGKAHIGNNSAICTSPQGCVTFGEGFAATAGLRLVCYNRICFGSHCLIGWDCLFLDTDFHSLTKRDGTKTKGYGDICIGCDNWFANGVKVLKNTITPDYITIACNTILSKSYLSVPKYSVIGMNNRIEVLTHDVYRDYRNDSVIYTNI